MPKAESETDFRRVLYGILTCSRGNRVVNDGWVIQAAVANTWDAVWAVVMYWGLLLQECESDGAVKAIGRFGGKEVRWNATCSGGIAGASKGRKGSGKARRIRLSALLL